MASILAIDPGTHRSGWVVYENGRVADCGVNDNWDVATYVRYGASLHPGRNGRRVDEIAIEMVEHYGRGMPAGESIFETCVWIGRFVQSAPHPDCVLVIPRREVKLELCGSSRAKDPNVRQALIDRVGPKGKKIGRAHV